MKQTALVTGASRGIGKAIAAALAARGYGVIGTCRAPRKLAAAERIPGVRYLALDLMREASVAALVRKVGDVDVLVNSAGVSPTGPAEETPIGKVREALEVNFVNAVRLTQAFLPGMRSRGKGALIFITSMKGEAPSPFSSLYSATKAALRAFAGCLRMEVKGFGITVAVIAPMYIRTSLPQEMLTVPRSPYADALRRVKENRDAMIARGADPAAVAAVVLRLLGSRRPRAFSTAGRLSRVQAFLARHLPRGLVEANMARRFGL
jgi:short-subunit dehydrogenase